MTLSDLAGKQIAVIGLGENHKHLVRYFEKHKIQFQVFDNWQSELDLDVLGFEVVFRTPGLKYSSAPIQKARENGSLIYSQTQLFFDLCPAKIIAVTGTKGKGTTATLIQNILAAAKMGRKIYLAGNIGLDPFEFIDDLSTDDIVVLELSSFQLQDLKSSPDVAVVLKITPEHLDYHSDFDEYREAKETIVKYQTAGDAAVLNYDSEITRKFAAITPARIFWNSISQDVRPGCFVKGETIMLEGMELMPVSEVGLLGGFNLENVTAGIAAASAAGVTDVEVIKKVVRDFKGLPHRLELVGQKRDVRYYDDSFSTTPETAAAALSAFIEPIVLIVGGSEKKADYTELGRVIAEKKVKSLVAIGVTGPKITASARDAGYVGKIYDTGLTDMDKIVAKAAEVAKSGDVVLLSPASASFDMFKNYKERGDLFKKSVGNLPN